MTFLGTTPADGPVRAKDAERILAAEMLAELRHLNQTQTAAQARRVSQVTNGVLDVNTVVLDATGIFSRGYHTAIGAITVGNLGATTAVLTSAPPAGVTPASGNGVAYIPALARYTIPLDSHVFTLYGAAGLVISYQAWTGLQPFGIF